MNIGSKNKKRQVLPSRPDPPTVDQILEDIDRAAPNDPLFSILEQTGQDTSRHTDSEVETRFQQCKQYLELNERLQEARGRLLKQREELRVAGEQLQSDVDEVRAQTLWLYTSELTDSFSSLCRTAALTAWWLSVDQVQTIKVSFSRHRLLIFTLNPEHGSLMAFHGTESSVYDSGSLRYCYKTSTSYTT